MSLPISCLGSLSIDVFMIYALWNLLDIMVGLTKI